MISKEDVFSNCKKRNLNHSCSRSHQLHPSCAFVGPLISWDAHVLQTNANINKKRKRNCNSWIQCTLLRCIWWLVHMILWVSPLTISNIWACSPFSSGILGKHSGEYFIKRLLKKWSANDQRDLIHYEVIVE